MSTSLNFLLPTGDSVITIGASEVFYFDAALAVGMGNIKMKEYEKCVIIFFDQPLHIDSCNDRTKWQVKRPDGSYTIPISVSLVSPSHALLSLPSIRTGEEYELAYKVYRRDDGAEVTGSIVFQGI
ncbi:MAG: hypothetical protein A2Y38_07530 [Spirochaetes bacterium GWB1_59_5]|nr:MAG: hypothetical protein A2Y38_07530 [Spirochaetes bacterium GWB1_59_5]